VMLLEVSDEMDLTRIGLASCFIPHHDSPVLSAIVFDTRQETDFVDMHPLGETERG
jgi:hypothetical protein